MIHKYKVINKGKLDSPKRRETLPAREIISEIGINSSDRIADIGCGIGYFTFPLAEVVGSKGLVYALDIEEEMLQDIKDKLAEDNIKNVVPVLTRPYQLTLENSTVGVAFLCTVMHEVELREKFLKEVNRILLADGKIIMIEWIKKDSDYGPPADHRLDKNTIKRNLSRTGFQEIEIKDFNEYFYIVTAKKK
jgi:Methylase involved in ubiquinone/menaquinone biosynthesis